MSEVIGNLENNLRKQVQLYRKITKLEKAKQEALVSNNLKEIESITAQEEKILLEVGRLEEERFRWAEFFGKELGKSAEDITLADLVENYPGLESVREEMEKQMSELKFLHETNTKLLENAVNLVNFTLQTLTTESKTTYSKPSGRSGKKDGAAKLSFIDKSV